MIIKPKLKSKDTEEIHLTLEEATDYLKKMGEWEGVWNLDRDIIIKWAEFLLVREERKKYENTCTPRRTPKNKKSRGSDQDE